MEKDSLLTRVGYKPSGMVWLRWPAVFLFALICNGAFFLLVPALQALLRGEGVKKKSEERVDREIAMPELTEEKRVRREIRRIEPNPLKPLDEPPRPARIGGGLKLDLSPAGGAGPALVSGGDRTGLFGSGSGGGKGEGMGSAIYNPGETDSDARILGADPQPRYPLRAEREGIAGTVDLVFVVNAAGFAEAITVLKESPEGYGFGVAAKETLQKLRFQPAVLQKTPVPQRVRRRYNFDP
jgi:protein TonB